MRNDNYFKRLDYRKQDIPTAPFTGMFFHTDAPAVQYMPIGSFIETTPPETLAKIFNTEKSPREKNCGLGKLFTDEVQAKRNSGFYLKIEADEATAGKVVSPGIAESGKTGGNAESRGSAAHGNKAIPAADNAVYDKSKGTGVGSAESGKGSGNLAGGDADNTEAMQDFFVRFTVDAAHSVLFDRSYIDIADNAAARLILYFDTDEKSPALQSYRNGLISIRVGKSATLEIIKVQNFADSALNFETVRMDVGEKARVTVHDIQLGSQKSGVSYSSYMQEDWAEVYIFPLYFVDKTRRMDLEHNLIINGKATLSEIKARGALKNNAHKVFRGNIFLNKGCSASVARFADNSIMLDKNTVGASIPTIFCDEDDVIGEHAASFAAIDKEKLYYLMSRGFDELSAKKLIINSAFRPVFNSIPDERVRDRLNAEFDTRLSAEQKSQTEAAKSGIAQDKMEAANV